MDKHRFYKFFFNNFLKEGIQRIHKQIDSFKSKSEFDVEFNDQWNRSVGNMQKRDWGSALEKLEEKIEMEKLFDTLDLTGERKSNKGRSSKVGVRAKVLVAVYSLVLIFSISAGIFYAREPYSVETSRNITKTTLAGQKVTFRLSDGTMVTMNSASELGFPEKFEEDKREVFLKGEAFFEVANDKSRPFTVYAGSLSTTVLGTSFNVSAYADENDREVSLVNGSVKVALTGRDSESLILNPGEKASFALSSNKLSKSNFNYLDELAWKEGIIYFSKADFETVKNRLEKWYGVSFVTQGDPNRKPWEFSGKFKGESLENILEVLEFAYEFRYDIKDKVVSLKFNENEPESRQ